MIVSDSAMCDAMPRPCRMEIEDEEADDDPISPPPRDIMSALRRKKKHRLPLLKRGDKDAMVSQFQLAHMICSE